MRASLIAGLCLTLAGCTIENELRHMSTLQTETSGIAMSADGLESYAAMSGTTCTIDTNWGCPVSDEDLPTEDEHIVDHYHGETLARSSDGLHYILGGTWNQSLDIPLAGVRAAKLTDDGPMALAGNVDGCALTLAAGQSVELPSNLCTGELKVDVDRRGRLIAATADGVYTLDENGAEAVSDADHASWDDAREQMYVARTGDTQLEALDAFGLPLWDAALDHVVVDVAARGDKGDVVLLVEAEDGFGRIERRDGETGKLKSSGLIPSADGELLISDNGRTIAVVRGTEVQFYELIVEGEAIPEAEDSTQKNCIDMPTGATQD